MNPLLYAATTASAPSNLTVPPHSSSGHSGAPHAQLSAHLQQQSQRPSQNSHHHSSGQTPTNIKTVRFPEYFSEWKEVGAEEAAFLGAQVAGKVVFVVDQGLSKGFMTRTEYNEVGPSGIHECCF